jgi:hypothetical protein
MHHAPLKILVQYNIGWLEKRRNALSLIHTSYTPLEANTNLNLNLTIILDPIMMINLHCNSKLS